MLIKIKRASINFERRRWNASPVPIEKLPRDPYDLQTFDGHVDLVTIFIKTMGYLVFTS